MNIILILLCIRGTIAGSLRTNHGHIKEKIPPKLSTFNQEHLDALQKEIKMLQETNEHAAAVELADTYRSRELIRDADRKEICFQDRKNYKAEADYFKDPFKANNDRGDWGKCLPEELFGILCEHEVPHMLNDGSWKVGDGPLHDELAEQLFLRMKSLHDKTCVHVDLDISDQVQEQFNDFLHARNKYAHTNIIGNGEITDVVLRVKAKGGKYFLNGIQNPELTFIAGIKYTFLTDGLEGHPFKIGIAVNSPFETGVTYNSNNVTVQLPLDVSMTSLVYYCKFHSTMGNTIKVLAAPSTTYKVTSEEGKYFLNGMMTPEITLIRGETYKFDVSDSSVNTHPFRIGTRESTNQSGKTIFSSNNYSGEFEEAVTLSDNGYDITYDIKEDEFNSKFEACPVVQYTRNRRVHSVYIRTSVVPDNFNAYKLFTDMWSDTDNVLHDDFEIYDDKDDLLEGKGKWEFCNFNDKDVGYPRDCGKKKKVVNQWFSMPLGRFDARGLDIGASFHIHSEAGCPSTFGPEVPYGKGVTYNTDEVIISVPMDAPNMLTYYCEEHMTPPGMGNSIIVPAITSSRSLTESDVDSDDDMTITYDMACVQKYPNNPRFAMQMSLYCMTAFFSYGDVSTSLFDSPYHISSSCDTMMRMHERTLVPSPVRAPYFCDQDVDNDTCTVRAYVEPYIGRTCRSYCESFHGLTCASANFGLDSNGGKCLAGREMSCDAEQSKENHMLCTCTIDNRYTAKVGAPANTKEPLTLSATKLLVQPQSQLLLCDQNFINDTVKVFTSKRQTCHTFCLSAGLACLRGADAEKNTCLTRREHKVNECFQRRDNQLCTCGPIVALTNSQEVKAAAIVSNQQGKSIIIGPGFSTDLVALSGRGNVIKTNVGEVQFNNAFAACPAVQYTRNEDVVAVYRRKTPIPVGFNAYKLFTSTWESTNNRLNIDFELYDSKDDLVNHEGKWQYCNYDDNDVGFPRDCGKNRKTNNKWFSMPGGKHNPRGLRKGASFAVHSLDGCPIDALISRNNATDVNNNACKRMAMQPHNGIKSYYGADRIIPNVPESCTVESGIRAYGNSCDKFCSTFKSMKCVGAHSDPNAYFQDGKALGCDAIHTSAFVACQCAVDATSLDNEKAHNDVPTSNACINLAFGGDFTSHEIYEYCDSNESTCTVNVNSRQRTTTCSEFCSSHQGMTCLSASETKEDNERVRCESSTPIQCDQSSSTNYLQCECSFISESERADTLKLGPVLEENEQDYCPAYTTIGGNDHSNEKERRYQKVTLTLGVDDSPEADGSIPVVAAKMVQDNSNSNLDSYNTQDVEVCNGLEYTTRGNDDPAETCSFGHRYDSKSNCYGKLEMSFENASEKCAARGGHLLRLDNEDEFNKLTKVFRRQRVSIGLHSDNTTHGMEWDGYPGCKVDLEQDLNYLAIHGRNIKQDCWELDLDRKTLKPHYCTDTKNWICEAHRPTETYDDKVTCKNDSKLEGDGGDLMKDEGGFCLFYLEDPDLSLPDDESGGFRNTEIAHFLAFSEETRTRKYYKEYGKLVDAEFRGHYENDLNWENLTRDKLGLNSTDYIVNIDHETDDFHCHFSPTNFGISRIYLQQHMLERIYPGAFKKHCFCGYKHLGKLVSRCDCTKNGVRNNNCQKEHRPMLYESTYKENGEYVYCNNGQCDQPSP